MTAPCNKNHIFSSYAKSFPEAWQRMFSILPALFPLQQLYSLSALLIEGNVGVLWELGGKGKFLLTASSGFHRRTVDPELQSDLLNFYALHHALRSQSLLIIISCDL